MENVWSLKSITFYIFDDDGDLNPLLCMDKEYTHKTATYRALSDLQGPQIYYGAFTLDIPAENWNALRSTYTYRAYTGKIDAR